MRKKDAINRLKMLRHRLILITTHWDGFEERLGKAGLQKLIDDSLDEMNFLTKTLKDWPEQGGSTKPDQP